jgi:predicted Zn-dependent protease
MRSMITITVAIGVTMATSTAYAATNGTVGKYSRKAVKVKSNTGFPTQCRPAILRAVQTWNSKNPRFQYSYATTNTAPSIENGNDNDLQFDYSTSVTSANTIAETRYRNNTTAGYSDADIVFNFNKMFYTAASGDSVGELYCPAAAGTAVPADKLDLESTSLHELGHAFGLDHFTGTTCTMFATQSFGQNKRTPCAAEVTVFGSIY